MRIESLWILLVLSVGAGCYNLTGRADSDAGDAAADVADALDVRDSVADVIDARDVTESDDVTDALDAMSDSADVIDEADAPLDACALTQCGAACVDTRSDPRHCGSCDRDCTALPNVNGASVRCDAGACEIPAGACDGAHGDCDRDVSNGCEADLTRAETCGACSTACAEPTPLCGASGGAPTCVSGCDATSARCAMSCVNTATDTSHCGGCDHACASPTNGRATCASGRCGAACDEGFHQCGDACASDGAAATCGARCDPCPDRPNATTVCAAGACGFACSAGFGDCDRDASNGCEVDTRTSGAHCGACASPCTAPTGSVATCVDGRCDVRSLCLTGQSLCGGVCRAIGETCVEGVGACARTGATECRADVVVCSVVAGSPSTEVCDGVDNDCDGLIDEGFCRIAGVCYADGQRNPTNSCQRCAASSVTVSGPTTWGSVPTGTVCRASAGPCDIAETCTGSSATCPADVTMFTGAACSAPTGGACSGLACLCPSGQTDCSGACRNTQTDVRNCGACARSCLNGEVCDAGRCAAAPPTMCPPLDPTAPLAAVIDDDFTTASPDSATYVIGGTVTISGGQMVVAASPSSSVNTVRFSAPAVIELRGQLPRTSTSYNHFGLNRCTETTGLGQLQYVSFESHWENSTVWLNHLAYTPGETGGHRTTSFSALEVHTYRFEIEDGAQRAYIDDTLVSTYSFVVPRGTAFYFTTGTWYSSTPAQIDWLRIRSQARCGRCP